MVKVLILENDNGERFHTIFRFTVPKNKKIDLWYQMIDYDKKENKFSQHTTCFSREVLEKIYKFYKEEMKNKNGFC